MTTSIRCTRCSQSGHRGINCPNRKPSTICQTCFGLPHRREPGRLGCFGCGKQYAAEPTVALSTSRGHSPLAAMESW